MQVFLRRKKKANHCSTTIKEEKDLILPKGFKRSNIVERVELFDGEKEA